MSTTRTQQKRRVGWYWLLASWGLAEVVFFHRQRARLQESNRRLMYVPDPAHIARTKQRFLQLRRVINFRAFLSGWFHNAPFEQITRGNVEDFVAYAFYDSTPANLSDKARQLTSDFVDACERTWGVSFNPGTSQRVSFMAHLWEPLRVMHKPLVIHLVSEATGKVVHCYLARHGFVSHRHKDLPYWIRQPAVPRTAAREQPLVFLHGVGFGLALYVQFIRAMLRTFPDRTIIVAEFAHVSLRVATHATAVDDIADSVQALLRAHGVADACILAHSFGCFVASRLCQMHPQVVHSLALLDPVCMMLCFPQLLHSFIYKPFDFSALTRLSGIVDVARWFCSRDLGIAEAFCRNFIWHSLMLWPDDLPVRTLLCMGARDDLVPAGLVRAQLAHAGSTAQVVNVPFIYPYANG
ncbi:hypothetical protein WJX72_002946 [[Myrmecia] bisecta]|uniref:AB hydrolase-1 domain-containing protein n=1 Tax=[Myrmecia] bisecta TaxID=41462 RepID=A0AAW1P4M9_9CHLO